MSSAIQTTSGVTQVPVSLNQERGGLNIQFDTNAGGVQVSQEWTMAGRVLQFAHLAPGSSLGLDQSRGDVYAKVVTGSLTSPERTPCCTPRGIVDTQVREGEIEAGADGALVAVITATPQAPQPITSMSQLAFEGPSAEALQWRSFDEQFKQFTDYFEGADAYIGPGFHILNEAGDEVTYVNIWTAGKGVDLSTHDHGQDPSPMMPAFAEIHWTVSNGTGKGGMYETPEPGAPDRQRYPVQTGEEHGPFFAFDPQTGEPRLRENGAVDYPWHGWEAGTDNAPGQAYDVIAAFETAPKFIRVR